MSIYKLPLGIKIPEFDEIPNKDDIEEITKNRNSANIVEGYVLREVKDEKFTYYAEINVNADNIWDLFVSLSNILIADIAYGIVGFKDEKPMLSEFTQKQRIFDILYRYKFELSNDGFLTFGMAHYDDISLNEIYISSFKYFKVWTTNKKGLIEALAKFGLSEKEDLNFIDEFPVVSKALSYDEIRGIRHYSQVLSEIESEFADL
ncbi:hypothetical protein [Pelosinus sp. IPA-1]|uniref:hypothetical protein n=1 Tax=Pelosinus sp. IPA-1 TaxID=3029569 RepID=UPI0024361FF0|nr:hypothetical protein [Pelosinus sp. IPA-1]GMA99504.1 hypothetical protein PIPA1_23040 [Pelosinus sp. IPA-1]